MDTPRGIFGDAAWPCRPADDAAAIIRTAERYCPELPFAPREDAVFEADCSLYPDYRLVCLCEPTRAIVYGFYAPGDFRPLDPYGIAIAHLNAIGPLQLTKESVVQYVLLRLCAEMPVLDAASSLVARGLDGAAARRLLIEFGPAAVRRRLPTPTTPKDAEVPADEAGWRKVLLADTVSTARRGEAEVPRLWPIVVRGAGDVPLAADAATDPVVLALAVAPSVSELPAAVAPATAAPPAPGHRVTVSVLLPGLGKSTGIRQLTVGVTADGGFTVLESNTRLLEVDTARAAPLIASAPMVRRTDTAMIDVTWRRLSSEEDAVWHHALRIFDFDRGHAVLRFARLTFYRTVQLMEVLVRHGAGYRRSYALVSHREGDARIVPLNGKSNVIHQTNAEAGEFTVDANTANDYLRFFCWAVQGTGGPFYVPLTLREAPLNRMPADAQGAVVRQIQFGIVEVGDEEAARLGYGTSASHFRRKAAIAYESAIFEAAFAVQPAGMIEMINDQPRAADLDLRKEEYGGNTMFVLRDFVTPRLPRPELHHYLRPDSGTPAAALPAPRRAVASIDDFVRAIAPTGEVAGLDVNAPVVFDAGAFSRPA